jgi:hypothetical protein
MAFPYLADVERLRMLISTVTVRFPSVGMNRLPRKATTHSDEARLYSTAPSIIDHVPWGEYLPEHECILLDDGVSVGAVYEIIPVGTEGRPETRLDEICNIAENALQDSLLNWMIINGWYSFSARMTLISLLYMDTIRAMSGQELREPHSLKPGWLNRSAT